MPSMNSCIDILTATSKSQSWSGRIRVLALGFYTSRTPQVRTGHPKWRPAAGLQIHCKPHEYVAAYLHRIDKKKVKFFVLYSTRHEKCEGTWCDLASINSCTTHSDNKSLQERRRFQQERGPWEIASSPGEIFIRRSHWTRGSACNSLWLDKEKQSTKTLALPPCRALALSGRLLPSCSPLPQQASRRPWPVLLPPPENDFKNTGCREESRSSSGRHLQILYLCIRKF